MGLESDEKSEELSFPHLFPSGQFGYSMDRKRPESLKKYFQARVLHADGRFSSSAEICFMHNIDVRRKIPEIVCQYP